MNTQKPIEPLLSRELVTSWYEEAADWEDIQQVYHHIASRAAQWGYAQRGAVNEAALQKARDEELEACCEWLAAGPWHIPDASMIKDLRVARRPKPKSQAEEAIAELDGIMDELHEATGSAFTASIIRAALERLRELEQSNG